MLSKYDTFSFNLYLSTVFLTFKYSTVFISLLGTIYFNLIMTFFFIYVEVSTVQCSCSNCVFTIFEEADNNKYPYKDENWLVYFYLFYFFTVYSATESESDVTYSEFVLCI